MARGRELCKESGYVGAITSRVCLFIQSFRDWRQQNLLDGSLRVCADLGLGVMEQAMVEAAAYVLAARPSSEPRSVPFLRLLLEEDRHAALGAVTASARNGEEDHRLFRVNVSDFAALPDSPIAYWVDRETVELLTSLPPFEPSFGVVRQGLATGDDFRFVRAWWEVPPERLGCPPAAVNGASELEQLANGARWAPMTRAANRNRGSRRYFSLLTGSATESDFATSKTPTAK